MPQNPEMVWKFEKQKRESFRAGKIIIYTRKKKMKDKKLYQLDRWLLRKRKQKTDL